MHEEYGEKTVTACIKCGKEFPHFSGATEVCPSCHARQQHEADHAAKLKEIKRRQISHRAYFPDPSQQSTALHNALDDIDWLLTEYHKLTR